jgi:DNA-binding response OmpR family regulator
MSMIERAVRRIVVADDEPDIADLLTMSLEMQGYDVRTAYDGEAARELVAQTLPDLVILDWMMPKMDGIAVLASLRSRPQTREIPVVMLSARASDTDVWDGWEAGANYYMTKPFDFDGLLRYISYLETGSDVPQSA